MKVSIIGFYSSSRKAQLTMTIPLVRKLESSRKITRIFILTPFPQLECKYKELAKFKKLQVVNFFNFLSLIKSLSHSKIVFGVFGDSLTNRHNLLSQFYNYFIFLLPVFLRKKLALISVTLFMPAFPNLLKLGRKNVIYCSVRDDKSLLLGRKFFKGNCILREDISFSFFEKYCPKKGNKRLIVCLRNNSYKIANIKIKEYSKLIARLIKKICNLMNINEVSFLALDFGVRKIGMDYLLHEEIKKELKKNELIISSKKCVLDLSSLIKEFESGSVILTSRFHGAIFSISLMKPFLVVDRDYKTFYFMKAHGLDKYYISPKDILNERKVEKILKLLFLANKKLKILRRRIIRKGKEHLDEILSFCSIR
jgi:polysaccharide pyruvyl transferase WcaK-like protein